KPGSVSSAIQLTLAGLLNRSCTSSHGGSAEHPSGPFAPKFKRNVPPEIFGAERFSQFRDAPPAPPFPKTAMPALPILNGVQARASSGPALACRSQITRPEGMPMARAYNVVDADGHILEPLTLWDDYIDPAFRDRRPRFVIDENGKERL